MSTPVSPKVTWPLFAGIIFTTLLANFGLITPDMLGRLGPWAPYVYGTAFTLLTLLVGYFKSDPLRDLGAEVAATPPGTGKRVALPTGIATVMYPAVPAPAPAAAPAAPAAPALGVAVPQGQTVPPA